MANNSLIITSPVLSQLISVLDPESQKEVAKFGIEKQIEKDIELNGAARSGVIHDGEVKDALTQVEILANTPGNQHKTIHTTIRSADGRIETHIEAKDRLFRR